MLPAKSLKFKRNNKGTLVLQKKYIQGIGFGLDISIESGFDITPDIGIEPGIAVEPGIGIEPGNNPGIFPARGLNPGRIIPGHNYQLALSRKEMQKICDIKLSCQRTN